jgi:hypothetical protein
MTESSSAMITAGRLEPTFWQNSLTLVDTGTTPIRLSGYLDGGRHVVGVTRYVAAGVAVRTA